jgi:hypothetical protein
MRIGKSVRFGIIGLAALGTSLAFAGVSSAREGARLTTIFRNRPVLPIPALRFARFDRRTDNMA